MSTVVRAAMLVLTYMGIWLGSHPSEAAFPRTFRLERAIPMRRHLDMSHMIARDRARHGRLLQGVIDYPVEGSFDPFTVGLYFTRVKLGSPAREFYVQIDTGSDLLWVTCNPCDGCPKSSGLGLDLKPFDPTLSSSVSVVPCSSDVCALAIQTQNARCSSEFSDSPCRYTYQYGDGSGSSGYYVYDILSFDKVVRDDLTPNFSASVVFGCSDTQSGDLTKPERALDGIFGFGRNDLSVISQLSSHGLAPKAFSHCLKGSDNGGGILVLGEVVEPGLVYTPMVPSQYHYNLNLKTVAVNGQTLPIDPAIFSTSTSQGTIVDSGTTLAYLSAAAFDPFVNSIINYVSTSVQSFDSKGNHCFMVTGSVDEIFPSVTLTFDGDASLVLKPDDYLIQQGSMDGSIAWCIGWQRVEGQGVTILGDLVLKDKIFVYDLAGERIGWANYDCSLPVNVSESSGKSSYVDADLLRVSSASSSQSHYLVVMPFLLYEVLLMFFHL